MIIDDGGGHPNRHLSCHAMSLARLQSHNFLVSVAAPLSANANEVLYMRMRSLAFAGIGFVNNILQVDDNDTARKGTFREHRPGLINESHSHGFRLTRVKACVHGLRP